MTTLTRQQIAEKATELYMKKQSQGFDALSDMKPETCELLEEGFLSDAKTVLSAKQSKKDMNDLYRQYCQTEKLGAKREILREIPFSVSEAMQSGFFISGTRQASGKTNLAKWLVQQIMREGIAVYVMDVSKAWLHDTPISNSFRVPNGNGKFNMQRTNTVFDLSALTLGERLGFVNNFSEAIYKSHVQGYGKPELIVFEEAQTYFPNGCMRSLRQFSATVDYLTVGGNFSTSFGLITQFPSMVDKAPVKAAQQRYFGLSTEFNDKTYIKSFIGKANLAALTNLKLGEFLYQRLGTVTDFQCERYTANLGNVETVKPNGNGYAWQYRYECPMVV